MQILRQTFLSTLTMATTSNGTSTLANLFDREVALQWSTENAGTDATAASLRIVFPSTQTVSQILLGGHNLRNFTIHPNTTTATFTPAISHTTNSATNHYFSVNTISLSEVVIQMNSTITANEEKKIGELIVSNLLYDFANDRLPTAKNYDPSLFKKQVVHDMSDGGTALFNLASKFKADIKMDFVPTSTMNSLRTIYDLGEAFVFVPFETSTSWNGKWAECVWIGDFDFEEFSGNDKTNGYKGKMKLRQTPGGSYA